MCLIALSKKSVTLLTSYLKPCRIKLIYFLFYLVLLEKGYHGEFHGVLFHLILTYDSYLKKVIHGHFVLYHVIVVVVDNAIRCNHDKV